jgi:hypothetical protein
MAHHARVGLPHDKEPDERGKGVAISEARRGVERVVLSARLATARSGWRRAFVSDGTETAPRLLIPVVLNVSLPVPIQGSPGNPQASSQRAPLSHPHALAMYHAVGLRKLQNKLSSSE